MSGKNYLKIRLTTQQLSFLISNILCKIVVNDLNNQNILKDIFEDKRGQSRKWWRREKVEISSWSLKTHLTMIQEKSHLLVKNVPNHFLRRSHSPVHCSLFHKRKSVVSFKDSKNFNLFSSSSFLSLSSFLFKYVFKYVLIVEEIIDHDLTENIWMKKRKLLSCQSYFK